MIARTAADRCVRCGRMDELLLGDGPIVCKGCIAFLTKVAADPREAGPTMRNTLAELHGDVLALVQPSEDSPDLLWRWLA